MWARSLAKSACVFIHMCDLPVTFFASDSTLVLEKIVYFLAY